MSKAIEEDKSKVVLQQIRENDQRLLKELYDTYRGRFIGWFLKNHRLEEEMVIEVYQRAFTIFYLNVKDGKITTLNSSIETYLFGIGKNLVKEIMRDTQKTQSLDDVHEYSLTSYEFDENSEKSHRQKVVQGILKRIQEPCKSILEMYYFRNFSMESIASALGYKNESVAKKKKCLCLQKIRQEMRDGDKF